MVLFVEENPVVCPSWQKEDVSIMNQPVPDELISAYFDGEVTPDERSQVEQWLDAMPELRQQLDDTSKLSALLHSFPRETAPSELATIVQRKIASVVQAPSVSPSTNSRSLRREWTAFGVGILATMASLVLFVRMTERFGPESSRVAGDSDHFTTSAPGPKKDQLSKSLASNSAPVDRNESMDSKTVLDSGPSITRENHLTVRGVVPTVLAEGLRSVNAQNKDRIENSTILPETEMSWPETQVQNGNFLEQLKTGDVFVTKVADLSNTVIVVDFTVVDIVREANDLKLVLQKRLLHQLENADDSSTMKQRIASAEKESEKKSPNSDDLQVFFIRAPGEELAGAIDEFSRNHPDLNWAPGLPIELPQLAAGNEEFGAVKKSLNNQRVSKTDDSDMESKVVTAEAELAYGAFLARNSVVPSTPVADSNLSTSQYGIRENTQTRVASRMRRNDSNAKPDATVQKTESVDETRQLNPSRRGYFQVSSQNPASASQALNSTQNNSTLPLLAGSPQPSANNGVIMNGIGGASYLRYWNSLPNNENRNSRLVKMLIVLKSDQSAGSRTP